MVLSGLFVKFTEKSRLKGIKQLSFDTIFSMKVNSVSSNNKFLNPVKKQLIVFSLLFCPAFAWFLYQALFARVPPFEIQVFFVIVGIIVLRLITKMIDKEYTTSLSKYGNLAGLLAVVLIFVAYSFQTIFLTKSEEQGEEIAAIAEAYKREKGTYPPDLQDKCFEKAMKNSLLGTNFSFAKNENESFSISFYAFRGNWATYSSTTKRWQYND